jgi:hypothetical protein
MRKILIAFLLLVSASAIAVLLLTPTACLDHEYDLFEFDCWQWTLDSQKWYNGKKEPVTLNLQALWIEGDGGLSHGTYKVYWAVKWRGYEFGGGYRDGGVPDNVWGPKQADYVQNYSSLTIREVKPSDPDKEPYDVISFDLDYGYYLGSYRFILNGDKFTITNDDGSMYLKFSKTSKAKGGQTSRYAVY